MIILATYTITNVSARQIEIPNPSLSTYLELCNNHENMKCPCTQISANYQGFVQLSSIFHQVCASDLISPEWIKFLFDNNKTIVRYAADFRATASIQFQALQELCQLSFTVVQDSIEGFYTNELISGELLSENLFKAQLKADIARFQMSTISDFRRALTFMRSFTFSNALIPAIETAYTFLVYVDDSGAVYPW
ncbi:unnamed protein product [Rotaria sp. Silwood2]|nr:unnamed protein product [Rotaria sp. Silwood2]CAF4320769.1 unnamed protein product [Rotaria sp. Silwood2]